MKIIAATENDLLKIQQIATKSWTENYKEMLSTKQIEYMLQEMYSIEELQKHFENPNYFYFFINNDEEKSIGIIGFEKNAEPKTTKLHRIYLYESEKGKNFGKLALDFLKNWVKNEGNNRIILNVNKNNPAIQFYKKLGFSIYDEGVFDIGNGLVMDDYLMEYLEKN